MLYMALYTAKVRIYRGLSGAVYKNTEKEASRIRMRTHACARVRACMYVCIYPYKYCI